MNLMVRYNTLASLHFYDRIFFIQCMIILYIYIYEMGQKSGYGRETLKIVITIPESKQMTSKYSKMLGITSHHRESWHFIIGYR